MTVRQKLPLTVSSLAKVAIFTTNIDAEHWAATFAKPVLATVIYRQYFLYHSAIEFFAFSFSAIP
jgi:hypothetical protein